MTVIASLPRPFGYVALLSLALAACGSASAADGAPRATARQSVRAAVGSAAPTAAPVPARANPPPLAPSAVTSSETLGSNALEHELDRLEKTIQSSPP